MGNLGKFSVGSGADLEQRFVGFVESIERKMHFSNPLFSHSYCNSCREYVPAEIQGGTSDDRGIKKLYCSCPKCYNLIILKAERRVNER